MEKQNQFLINQQISPKYQALTALGAVIIIGGLGSLFGMSEEMSNKFPWMIGLSFILLFAIFNSILWLSAKNMLRYFSESMTWFTVLILGSGLFAFAITGLHPSKIDYIQSIFIVLMIGYSVFMGISATIRNLVSFFNKEEEKKLSGKYDQIKRKKRKKRR